MSFLRWWLVAVLLGSSLLALEFRHARAKGTDTPPPRQTFVPAEDLDAILDRDQRGILLSRPEFEKLAAAARKNRELEPPAGVPVALSRAEFSAEPQEDQLVLTALLEFHQLAPGWQIVSLPFRNVSVERAALDDKPAQLARTGDDRQLVLFSSQTGRHSLALKLSTPLVSLGSDKAAAFGFPSTAAATLNVSTPAGQFLQADDVSLERPAPPEQPALYALAIGGKNQINLRLTGRQAQKDSETLVFAGTAIGLHVAPEERTWRAVTTLNVFGKPVDALQFRIPKSLDIISVDSPGLERWEIVDDAGATLLKLAYRQAFSETRTVTFRGVSASLLGQPWSVPTLSLSSATSHLVRILVQHQPGLRLQPVEATGVRRIAPEAGATADSPDVPDMSIRVAPSQMLHYAAWRDDFSLLFVTRPRARELQATIVSRVDIESQEIGLTTSVAVQSRFGPLFDLDLSLPVEWNVVEVLHGQQPVKWRVVPLEAGRHLVRVPFEPSIPTDGRVQITLRARHVPMENWPLEDQPLTLKLPEVELPQVAVAEGRYLVAAGDDLDLMAGEITGLEPVRLTPEEQQLSKALRLAYEYQDTKFSASLTVARKPLRLAAQTVAFHRLDRQTLVSHLEARLVAQGGGIRRIQLALPESAGTDLRFQTVAQVGAQALNPPQITEQTASPPAGGERIWTLQLDQRTFGLLWLTVDLERSRDAEATSFELPALRVIGADRQAGHIAIEASPDQQLTLTATDVAGQALSELDPADVLVPVGYAPRERIVAAYQTVRPGFRVSATEKRFDRQAIPTAICDRMLLTTVLSEAGELQHEADLSLRAAGVQGLQVELPADAAFWAALVDGKPLEVRRSATVGGETFLVPLPLVADAQTTRRLQLFYRTMNLVLHNSGQITATVPKVAAVTGQGGLQPLETLQRDWVLYRPQGTDIISSDGAFEPPKPFQRDSLLGWLQQNVHLGQLNELQGKFYAVGIAGLVVGVLWLSYRRGGTQRLLTAIVAGVCLVIVAVLFLPAVQQARVATLAKSSAPAAATENWYGEERYGSAPIMDPVEGEAAHPGFGGAMGGGMPAPAIASTPALRGSGAGGMPGESGIMPGMGGPVPQRADELSQIVQQNEKAFTKALADDAPRSFNLQSDAAAPTEPKAPRQEPGKDIDARMGMGVAPPEPAKEDAPPAKREPQLDVERKEAGGVIDHILGARGGEVAAAPKSKSGALLSLAINLQPAPNSVRSEFRYVGDPLAGAEPQLEIGYQDRWSLTFVSLAWQAGVVLLFWLSRKWSAALRAALAVLGLVAPIALVPLAPLAMLPVLDSLFLGTLWGLLLWAVLGMIGFIKSPATIPSQTTTAALILIAVACGLCANTSQAESPPAISNLKSQISNPPSVVVPYDPTLDPRQASRVFLPFDKFLELWRAAHPEEAPAAPAPSDGLIAEALYAAEVREGKGNTKPVVTVTARFVLHNFRTEPITLGLPIGQIALTSAVLDGQSAPTMTRDTDHGPELAVVVPQQGAHVLDVEFAVPLQRTGPAGQFTLPLKAVPAGALRFTLPGSDQALKVAGGRAYRRVKEGDRAVAIVPIDAGGDVTLSWAPSQARDNVEGLTHATGITAVKLGDAGVRLLAQFQLTVRQGTLSEATFSLPTGLLVRQISGPDVGGWEIAGDGEARGLKVFLRRAVSDATTLQFDLFEPQEFTEQSQSVTIPEFAPRGVARETGTLGIFVEPQLFVSTGAVTGLSQIDVAQFVLPPGREGGQSPERPQLAYRYVMRPFQLQLLASRQKPEPKGVAEHAVLISAHKQRIVSRFELTLAGAPRSEIVVQLPADYLLNDLKSHDAADYYVEKSLADGLALLHIDLAAPRSGRVELILDGVVPRSPADMSAPLVFPIPALVSELRSSAAVWLHRGDTAVLADHSGWKSVDPAQLPARLSASRKQPVQFAFTSNLTAPQPISLTLKKGTPRLSAEAVSVVLARETSVQYALTLHWRITQAGETEFVFTTPDWLAGRLEIGRTPTGSRVRQIVTEGLPNNRLRWRVSLEEPREGDLLLSAEATLPPPENARISAATIQFEQMSHGAAGRQYAPLESQQTFVVLINQSLARFAQESPDAVEAVSAQDLPIKLGTEVTNQAAEILRVRNALSSIGWRTQSGGTLQSLPASVNLAKMTLVVSRDGSWRCQGDYRINNRSRQFMALRMPADSRVLSLFVAGQAARPIDPGRANDPQVLLVPLPKTAAGDLSAEVKIVFAGRLARALPRGVQVLSSEFDLPAPQVLSQAEDADFGMPVAATEWTVILPEDIDAERIEDPSRSNVAESQAGTEALISAYQEWLSLARMAADSTLSKAQRSRAQDNLKQLGVAVHSGRSLESIKDERQTAVLGDLSQKVQAAQQELAEQRAKEPAIAEGKRLSSHDVNRDIAASNAALFDHDTDNDGTEREGVFVDLSVSPAEKPADPQQGQAAGGAKRSKLKGEAKAQSSELNVELENRASLEKSAETARGRSQDHFQPRFRYSEADPSVDADDVLEFTRENSREQTRVIIQDGAVQAEVPQGRLMFGRGVNVKLAAPAGQPEAAGAFDFAVVGHFRVPTWSQAGGLSLLIDIPRDGRAITFAKSGGDAKLALGLRPRTSLDAALGLGWLVLWLLAGLGLIAALGRESAWRVLPRVVPVALVIVGLAWFFLFPFGSLGLGVFVVGLVILAWQHRRAAHS